MKKILLISFLFAATFAKGQQGTIPSAAHIVLIGGGLNSDSATQLNVNITDTAAVLRGLIDDKLAISDTTVFSRKSMPSYSIRVNNTNATANATTDNFKTSGEGALSSADSVTWTGSSAPSGGTNNVIAWTHIGNRVWVDITLSNTSNGSGITGVIVKLPTALPTPRKPTGQTAANQYMYPVNAVFISSTNAVLSGAARGGIRNNSVNNAYEMAITTSSIAPCTGTFSFTYTTN